MKREVKVFEREEKIARRIKVENERIRVLRMKQKLQIRSPGIQSAEVRAEERRRIRVLEHQRRVTLRRQERIRVRLNGLITRDVRKYKVSIEKLRPVVETCRKTKAQTVVVKGKKSSCKKIVKRYINRRDQLKVLKTERRIIVKKIQESRKDHVRTFRKIPSVPVKRRIIVQRYRVKIHGDKRRVQRVQKRIVKLERVYERNPTPAIKVRIERQKARVEKLRTRIQRLKTEERKVQTVSTANCACPCCTSCADSLHKILNVIHINIIRGGSEGFSRVERRYRRTIRPTGKVVVVHSGRRVRTYGRSRRVRTYGRSRRVRGERRIRRVRGERRIRVTGCGYKNFLKVRAARRARRVTKSASTCE